MAGTRGGLASPHTESGRHLLAQSRRVQGVQSPGTRDYGIPEGGFAAVREDLKTMMVASQDFFPADFQEPHGPHYGGLMIRLAWHCSGSYRRSDGRGGCDGGRIRFDPELNWDDNANLNNALKLLEPIKEKYGSTLSWGDLIILAGTTAIEFMGGPVLGFCGGRVDDVDGGDSLILGPSPEQEELTPCQNIGMQGECQSPLGPTTVGLIYVNPEGPVTAHGDPVASGIDIREAFSRMGFNDAESVALIGGGHAFGKTHGACLTPPCGEEPLLGIGPNTFTSGFEGAWTTIPTTWSNQFFTNLLDFSWQETTGPGGKLQWAPMDSSLPIIMLTSDLALAADPDYLPISTEFASNITALEDTFAHAWYRLMNGDMGPASRCINEDPDNIPSPQWWQYPIPTASGRAVDYVGARALVQDLIDENRDNIAAFSNLALRCASTYRATDHRGGCNGARIRLAPESEWRENEGTQQALAALESIKVAIPDLSYADLIVLAGQTALEASGDVKLSFCGGREDVEDAAGSEGLAPRYYTPAVVSVRDDMDVKGLSPHEGVALYGIPTSGDRNTVISKSGTNNVLSNQYFIDLLVRNGNFTEYELALLGLEFRPIVEEYAADEEFFLTMFKAGWTKMMNADRFDGPVNSVCDSRVDPTLEEETRATGLEIGEISGGGEARDGEEVDTSSFPEEMSSDSATAGRSGSEEAKSSGTIPGMAVGLVLAAATAFAL